MADLTLLANCTASSPSCHGGERTGENEPTLLWIKARTRLSRPGPMAHLLVHGGQVPDVADQGPAGHHPQQVVDHAVLGAVPKGVSKFGVVLAGGSDITVRIEKGGGGQKQRKPRRLREGREAYLDGHGVYGGANLKAPLLKHHDGRVVDAGACGNQTGGG